MDTYFFPSINKSTTISRYKTQAEELVANFYSVSTASEMDEYRKAVRDDEIVKAVKKGWLKSIGESMVAAVASSILIAGFSTAFWLYGEMQESKRLQQLIRQAAIDEELKQQILNSE